jgi:hypothetical protein
VVQQKFSFPSRGVCLNVYAVYKLVQGQTHLGYALPCATDYGPLELKAKAALIVKMSHDDDVVSTALSGCLG